MEQPKKKMATWKVVLLGIGVVVAIGSIFGKSSDEIAAENAQQEMEDFQKAREDTLLSCYVMSERFLKDNLKDPDSYEEVEHDKFFVENPAGKPAKAYIQVSIKYRAKNSFGGYNLSKRCFNFDKATNLTDQFECD
ncbi:MAG: hypothetical protein EAZ63_03560 [Runella slithyformis]|nr:MAG: hypothetical protein EAZ63_03560 [Runella slithyformis]